MICPAVANRHIGARGVDAADRQLASHTGRCAGPRNIRPAPTSPAAARRRPGDAALSLSRCNPGEAGSLSGSLSLSHRRPGEAEGALLRPGALSPSPPPPPPTLPSLSCRPGEVGVACLRPAVFAGQLGCFVIPSLSLSLALSLSLSLSLALSRSLSLSLSPGH